MKLIKESLYEIKKSKFYSFNYEVDNIDEIKSILESVKKEHKKARHIVYAYKIDGLEKKCDDGEPSGTAGMPLYNIINKKNLNHILIVEQLSRGCESASVETLQNLLRDVQYDLEVDGRFGEETEKYVKQFQKDNNLTADGIVGSKTWKALIEAV